MKGNLQQPEHAPAAPQEPIKKPDGRKRRQTGRKEPFATRVTIEFKEKLDWIAAETGWLYVEVLEQALNDLEKKLKSKKKQSSNEKKTGV